MPLATTLLICASMSVGFWMWTLVDVIRRADWQVRVGRRPIWIAVVTLLPVIGAVAWLAVGRPRGPIPLPAQRMHPSMYFTNDDWPASAVAQAADAERTEFLRRFHERVAQQRSLARGQDLRQDAREP